jgi:serine/threonine protein kinase
MNCPHCQKALRDDSRFCTGCGQALDNPSNSTTQIHESKPEVISTRVGDPLLGHILDGKYQLISRLGAGGMGTVYRARRVHIGDDVAVKVLHTKYVAEHDAIERFRREARAAAQLRHPNVVVIYDYGEAPDAGVLGYIVMELVEGQSLGDILKREGRLKPERAIALMRQICAGVGAAHKRNIIHRDLKPDNIVVLPSDGNDEETVKVVDFGLAKLRDKLGLDAHSLTQTGMIMGTPYYMSPEQCRGDDLDSRADVYSLGAILFEMLVGDRLFNAPSAAAVIVKHLMDPAPLLPNIDQLPPALTTICSRALSKEATDRQADASELAREINAALDESRRPRIVFPPDTKPPERIDTKLTGAPAPLETLTHVGAQVHQPARRALEEPTRKGKGRVIGAVLAIVSLVVISVAAAAFYFTRDKPSSTRTEAKTPNANTKTELAQTTENSTGPIGGTMDTRSNSSTGENSRLLQAIQGRWKTRTGKLEIEFKEAPTGLEGIILRVPDSWPKSRVKIGDAIFVK